jgi:hypothetical protein
LHFSLNFASVLQCFYSDLSWFSTQRLFTAVALYHYARRLQLARSGLFMSVHPEKPLLTEVGMAVNQIVTAMTEDSNLSCFFPVELRNDYVLSTNKRTSNDSDQVDVEFVFRKSYTQNIIIPIHFANFRIFLESIDFKIALAVIYYFLKAQIVAWYRTEQEPRIVTSVMQLIMGMKCFIEWKLIEEAKVYLENGIRNILKLPSIVIRIQTIILSLDSEIYHKNNFQLSNIGSSALTLLIEISIIVKTTTKNIY